MPDSVWAMAVSEEATISPVVYCAPAVFTPAVCPQEERISREANASMDKGCLFMVVYRFLKLMICL